MGVKGLKKESSILKIPFNLHFFFPGSCNWFTYTKCMGSFKSNRFTVVTPSNDVVIWFSEINVLVSVLTMCSLFSNPCRVKLRLL